MSKRHSNTLRTAGVHVFQYNLANARRIVQMMTSGATPPATRRSLRGALKRLAACTDINRREALSVEQVAVLLRVGSLYQPGEAWQRAHAALADLWTAFNAHDRAINPRR